MVEAEAQQKICPYMSGVLSPSVNTTGVQDPMQNWEVFCIGSRCMAWEQSKGAFSGTIEGEGYCKLMEDNRC